jgi:hypothetical protein
MEIRNLRNSFIDQIKNAESAEQLKTLEENIYKIIDSKIVSKTGYKYANIVPKDKFKDYQKTRMEIYEKFNREGELDLNNLIHIKKEELMPSHISIHESEIKSPIAPRGGKRKSRRNLKNKKFRKTRRKSTRKTR